jgi:uncharacterized MAPEG superfamily protein
MQMPAEILVLAFGVALLFVHITLQAVLATGELGSKWNASPRDEGKAPKGVYAGRADRALKNYLETFPAFIALALALAVLDKTGDAGANGAWLWLGGRIAYIPLYLAGIPYIRTLAWIVSAIGLFRMFTAVFS